MEFETNCFPENMSHCVSVLRKKYPGSLVVVGEPQGRDPCKLSRMAEAGWLGLSVCDGEQQPASGEGGGETEGFRELAQGLYEALNEVEWVHFVNAFRQSVRVCPRCRAMKGQPHAISCEVGAEIGKAEALLVP